MADALASLQTRVADMGDSDPAPTDVLAALRRMATLLATDASAATDNLEALRVLGETTGAAGYASWEDETQALAAMVAHLDSGAAVPLDADQGHALLLPLLRYLLGTAASGALRDAHYPSTASGRVRTTFLEAAATNRVVSPASDVAFWNVIAGATLDANAAEAPDGATTALQITLDALDAGVDYVRHSAAITVSAATTYTYSVWLKAAPGASGDVGIALYMNGVANGLLCAVTDEWQRYSITVTASTGLSTVYVLILDERAGQNSLQSYYVWHPQLEVGTVPSSEVRTAGAQATRAADVLSTTLAAGDVRLRWYDRSGVAQEAIVAHGGGTYTVPTTGGRAYYEIDLDTGGGYAAAYRPGDTGWTHTRASDATYTARNPPT